MTAEVSDPTDIAQLAELERKLEPNWSHLSASFSSLSTESTSEVRKEPLKLVITPVIDLKHVIPKPATAKKAEVDRMAKFFIKSNEQVEYLGVFLDHELSQFYNFMLRRPLMVNPRVGDFNSDTEQMSSFAVFVYKGHLRFPDLAQVLHATREVRTGDEIVIHSNSFALSIEEIFAHTIHTAIVASNSPKFGVFLTDARGFPEIEGSLVTRSVETLVSDKPADNLYSVVGIVIPGVFYRNSFREYITIGTSFKNLARSLVRFLNTYNYLQPVNRQPKLLVHPAAPKGLHIQTEKSKSVLNNRLLHLCSTFLNQFDLVNNNTQVGKASLQKDDLPQLHDGTDTLETSNPVVEFWLRRTVKISVSDSAGISDIVGTGIAINQYLVLTNKHVVAETLSSVKVLQQGRSVPVQWVLPNKGALDLAFLVTKFALSLPDDDRFVGQKIGLSPVADKAPQPGEKVYSIGFPNMNYSPELHPFLTAGGLIKTFHYKGQPTLLHFSGLIFAGNSGGCILNAKGQLLGVVYANLELSANPIDLENGSESAKQKMTLNEMAFGICLASEAATLRELIAFDRQSQTNSVKNNMAGMVAQAQGLKLLSIEDSKLADAQSLSAPRSELEKCLNESSIL